MDDEKKSIAASQWTISSANTSPEDPSPPPAETGPMKCTDGNAPDSIKKRGFFEAISFGESPQKKMEALLKNYELRAIEQINGIDTFFNKKIEHLQKRIVNYTETISKLEQNILLELQYKEADDIQLQQLLQEKIKEEERLMITQQEIMDVRIRLGEAKAGIINKSLDEAENQVKKALNIQNIVYDETRKINNKKYEDGKDYLARLSACYKDLLEYYKKRYEKVNRYLQVLDVDGISPVTTAALTTIGTISFGAAGFFFSTFAGNAGFGNKDMLYFVLDGLIRTAEQPANGFFKLGILIGLIALITAISFLCNHLIERLKRTHEEEVFNKVTLGTQANGKLEQLEYQMNLTSNNWYAFWLQLIPGIFIVGLIILSLSQNYRAEQLGNINASSEGFIIGTSIAMSLAGLVYLYIIKIVEPRLLKHYDAHPDQRINWTRANWELVMVIVLFVLFSIGIILIPYGVSGSVPLDQQIRYAILLFLAICLVGSMSFAYSVRSRGLIQTTRYLERGIRGLNKAIAYCSGPQTPDVHHTLAPEHGNVLEHVLKQLSFKAAVNLIDGRVRTKSRRTGFFGELIDVLKRSKKQEEQSTPEYISYVTVMEPWEEKYFPHIVDELKAKEFQYREQQLKYRKVEDNIGDYKADRINSIRSKENEIALCKESIKECETLLEAALLEKAQSLQKTRDEHDETVTLLLDGFHLGIWYRQNGMGPILQHTDSASPAGPTQYYLLPS